jgi:hypothetical protein
MRILRFDRLLLAFDSETATTRGESRGSLCLSRLAPFRFVELHIVGTPSFPFVNRYFLYFRLEFAASDGTMSLINSAGREMCFLLCGGEPGTTRC